MTQVHSKLIVITRRDLSSGQQMIQAAHAAIQFQHEHPKIAKEWNTNSKYLIFLSVENEYELTKFLQKIQFRDLKYAVFTEPDIGNQLTAIAIEPNIETYRLTSNLPLALKEIQI